MENAILQTRSFDLAVSVYGTVAELQKKQKEFLLSQWWGESISTVALHMFLAQQVHTKRNLSLSLYSARKAAYKGMFWTKFLQEVNMLPSVAGQEIEEVLTEIIKMLQASISTLTAKRKVTIDESVPGEIS